MKAAVIVIGDELLLGQVNDTNSGAIARTLAPMGWEVKAVFIVHDDGDDILKAVSEAMSIADVVITTGGLGPTKDDITKTTLCRYFGCGMRHDPQVERNVEMIFAKRGLKLNDLTRTQADVPDACTVIQNRYGTAPIMWFECQDQGNRKVLVSMPGVPFETEGMLPDIAARIAQTFTPDALLLHSTFIVTDITESDLAEKLDSFEASLPHSMHLAYLPSPGYIRLRLDAIGSKQSAHTIHDAFRLACAVLTDIISDNLLYTGDLSPAAIALDYARRLGMTISAAESCTGGNISARFTAIPGASDTYMGGVVSYSNEMKIAALGVSADTLATHGAVSREVVTQMSQGVRTLAATQCAIATSGIAGPGGGTPEKPVGTVWIAVRVADHLHTQCYRFPGSRERITDRAATTAIITLAKILKALLTDATL